jgi:hypothetical protein
MDPDSGYMISSQKDTTVYLQFLDSQCLPFPDLDGISSQLIPFYDFSENINIDQAIVRHHSTSFFIVL